VPMFRLSRWLCQRNVFVLILFGIVCGTIILNWSSDRWYNPVFSLLFLDVYELYLGLEYLCRRSPVLLYIMGYMPSRFFKIHGC
jgi:hypothetical protein